MIVVANIPYWRLSSFYFFYFSLVGALSPYFGLYLSDSGLSAYAIGLVNAVLMGTKIIAPNIWGWLCDHAGQRMRIITLGSFLATVFFAGLFYWQSLMPVLIIVFLYSFFWNAVLSQFDAVTVRYLQHNNHRYSHIRLWGSIGFALSVLVLGALFDVVSVQYLIPVAWVLLFLIWVSCLSIAEPPSKHIAADQKKSWLQLLNNRLVIAFFVAAFLLQFSFGAYYTFFSLYLENYGYSRFTIGCFWAIGVVAEVIVFFCMHRIMPKLGAEKLLMWSLLLTSVRWFVTAFFAEHALVMTIAQLVHAFSFGAAHAACIELVRRYFSGRAGLGNALYSSVTFGAGGAIGALASGFLWVMYPSLLFVVSALAVLLAAGVVAVFLTEQRITA